MLRIFFFIIQQFRQNYKVFKLSAQRDKWKERKKYTFVLDVNVVVQSALSVKFKRLKIEFHDIFIRFFNVFIKLK